MNVSIILVIGNIKIAWLLGWELIDLLEMLDLQIVVGLKSIIVEKEDWKRF
ncbi:MAG: hypothetical protein LBC61_04275 [Candidatus Peribacteria bacterium]|nr:hypothetical protein [Candidatus Peribacteria bacterium]